MRWVDLEEIHKDITHISCTITESGREVCKPYYNGAKELFLNIEFRPIMKRGSSIAGSPSKRRHVEEEREWSTLASGRANADGIFTLPLHEKISCQADEELTLEFKAIRIPPLIDHSEPYDLSCQWSWKSWGEPAELSEEIFIENDHLVSPHTLLQKMTVLPDFRTDPKILGNTNEETAAKEYRWTFGARFENDEMTLLCTPQLADLIGWPRKMEITNGDLVPPIKHLMSHRQSINIMCENIEESHYQGTVTKPFVESSRMLSRRGADVLFTFGASIQGRQWDRKPREFTWAKNARSSIESVRMWVEDMYGQKHTFPDYALMSADILWRKKKRALGPGVDEAEKLVGYYVVEFDGHSGMWDMGGVKDWSGRGKHSYEVALFACGQSYSKIFISNTSAAFVQVRAPDFLENEDILYNGPWNVTPDGKRIGKDDSLWYPNEAQYKRIRPVQMAQTQLTFRVLHTSNTRTSRPFIVRKSKIVLHIRKV